MIVTPYLAGANNGNWRTALRWSKLLTPAWQAILQAADAPVTGGSRDGAAALIALHARRSRAAIAAWKRARPDQALIVALTGTDLYHDVPAEDADTLASIADADRLIVLQADAIDHVPRESREKVRVVYQSARSLQPFEHKPSSRLDCVFVSHLRDEKDPATMFAAWRKLPPCLPATLTIYGEALDASLGAAAIKLAGDDARVRYLGAKKHAHVRQAIKRAHVLIVSSRMEGGANVVVEAITAGTPVIASRMSGNIGMLGRDYPALFDVGDAAGLAAMVTSAHVDREFLRTLQARCGVLAPRFAPECERAALLDVVAELKATSPVE